MCLGQKSAKEVPTTEVEKWFWEIHRVGLKPNAVIFNNMLDAFQRRKEFKKMVWLCSAKLVVFGGLAPPFSDSCDLQHRNNFGLK